MPDKQEPGFISSITSLFSKKNKETFNMNEIAIRSDEQEPLHEMKAKRDISTTFVYAFPILIALIIVLLNQHVIQTSEAKDLITTIYQVFSPFLGMIVGYYFAQRKKDV